MYYFYTGNQSEIKQSILNLGKFTDLSMLLPREFFKSLFSLFKPKLCSSCPYLPFNLIYLIQLFKSLLNCSITYHHKTQEISSMLDDESSSSPSPLSIHILPIIKILISLFFFEKVYQQQSLSYLHFSKLPSVISFIFLLCLICVIYYHP